MPPFPTKAFVLGLLTDLEPKAHTTTAQLAEAEQRAAAIDTELRAAAQVHAAAHDAMRRAQLRGERAAARMGEANNEIASLRQKMATLQRKADELREALKASLDPEQQNQLRRARAPYLVSLEDYDANVNKLSAAADQARKKLNDARAQQPALLDRERVAGRAVDRLREVLPPPELYLRAFAQQAARAHCHYALDADAQAWQRDLMAAIERMHALHLALRAGRYRLDEHSDVVGGRAVQSAEAIFGLAAMGNYNGARTLFGVTCDETLFFHQIFHVFRAWCLGLYLLGRHDELRALARLHEYTEGMEGAYAQAFLALLDHDAGVFGRALPRLVRSEWAVMGRSRWPGLGVINLGALSLCKLARAMGLVVPELGTTVPRDLL